MEVDELRVDFNRQAALLIPHIDKPGVIGAVGRLLGEISTSRRCTWDGRESADAVMLLSGQLAVEISNGGCELGGVLDVRYVRM